MGGGAFAQAAAPGEPTLRTPRMSSTVYTPLKETYTNRLRTFFPPATQVTSLTEAPEKSDYGDMDIIIASDARPNLIDLANHIGAAALICHSAQSATLAVSKDASSKSVKPAVLYKHVQDNKGRGIRPSASVSEEEYAQLDVEIVPTELFEWHRFYASYGDMAGLLGHIVHNLGFTVSDRGLWLRMRELDDSKKPPHAVNVADKDGVIHLSHDLDLVMRFLGLSVESYEAGFNTLEALYAWLGECKLLMWEAIKVKRDNAHERNREAKRTTFTRFFQEWLPAHLPRETSLTSASTNVKTTTATADAPPTNEAAAEALLAAKIAAAAQAKLGTRRAELVQEAITFFNVQAEYEAKHTALVRNIHSTIATQLLKPILAQHSGKTDKGLNEVVRAFRRYVGVVVDELDGQRLCVLETAREDAESELWRLLDVRNGEGKGEGKGVYGLKDEGGVSEWAREHWEEVRGLERGRLKGVADAKLVRPG